MQAKFKKALSILKLLEEFMVIYSNLKIYSIYGIL